MTSAIIGSPYDLLIGRNGLPETPSCLKDLQANVDLNLFAARNVDGDLCIIDIGSVTEIPYTMQRTDGSTYEVTSRTVIDSVIIRRN